mgnify:CR=1 FL=1
MSESDTLSHKQRKESCMEKKTESTYNADIRAEQKYRYGDQGNDIDADELETESDPVTEDM